MIVRGVCPARITFCVAGLPKGLTCLYFMWVPGCPCWGRMESKGSTQPNPYTHTHTHTHTLSFYFLKKRESGFHGNLTTYRSEASKLTFLDVNQVSPPTCFPRAPKCSVGVSPVQSLGAHSLLDRRHTPPPQVPENCGVGMRGAALSISASWSQNRDPVALSPEIGCCAVVGGASSPGAIPGSEREGVGKSMDLSGRLDVAVTTFPSCQHVLQAAPSPEHHLPEALSGARNPRDWPHLVVRILLH